MQELGKKRRKKLQAKVDEYYSYRTYEDSDIRVGEGLSGTGVYAIRQFLPGELVFEVTGQLLRQSQYEGSSYVMELCDQWYLEPTIPGAFLNHSCSPNAELVQLTTSSLAVVALCNIEPESEITFDYQWQAADWIPKCRCGALTCRGWVVAESGVETMKKLTGKKKKNAARAK